MTQESKEKETLISLESIYVSVAKSVEAANRVLEKESREEIAYAVVESEVSVPFQAVAERQGEILLQLPEIGSSTAGLQRVLIKVKPVPRLSTVTSDTAASTAKVPQLARLTVAEAMAALASSGFRAGKIAFDQKAKPQGVVLAQNPAAGTTADTGTHIDLTVAGDSFNVMIPPEAIGPRE